MADEEEDWFERALREDDAADDSDSEADADSVSEADTDSVSEADTDSVSEADAEADSTADGDLAADETAAGDPTVEAADGAAVDEDDATGRGDEAPVAEEPSDGVDWGVSSSPSDAGGDATVDGPAGAGPEGDLAEAQGGEDDLFEEDFASALEGGGGGGDVGSATGDEDFGFDVGGGDGDFGFDAGAGGGFGDGDFDDEAYQSDISRIELGIEGLDEMILGGVPERSLMVVMGSAGTGKTTFGLQFLQQALANDESGVFITLEETRERILSTASEKGWDFDAYVDEGRLAIVDLDPIEMANSLTSIRNELPALVEEFGASRLVLDSVSLLEMMYDDQASRRSEVYDFTKSLKAAGVTTMLTSEASEETPFASRYGIIEYLTDAVFVLRYVRPEDFRETRLAVEIQKIRDANHSRETKPYEITNEGISVYRQANIF